MMPPRLPGWVASENKRLYSLIFIAPTLIHGILLINIRDGEVHRTWRIFSMTVGGIIVCILCFFIHPLVRPGIEHQLGILLFLLSLSASINGITIGLNLTYLKIYSIRNKYIPIIKPLLALSFPLTAIFVNNEILFDAGVGNFSNVSFYVWCVINALGICAPDFKYKTYRIVTFLIRSATYSYIIGLMIVFMPRLPLSAIAISSFGLGYLMVTPLIIIIFHTKLLLNDTTYLYYHLSRQNIKTMFVTAVSVPIIIYTFGSVYERM
jgi:hypothetical protein